MSFEFQEKETFDKTASTGLIPWSCVTLEKLEYSIVHLSLQQVAFLGTRSLTELLIDHYQI